LQNPEEAKHGPKKKIGAGLADVVPVMKSGAVSAAAWISEFAKQPRTLWVRDEFFHFLKAIEQPGPLADMKDYLLRIYDNESIERTTKHEQTIAENPALSILGFTALQPFVEGVSPESLVDGFAQRFGFIVAHPDKNREMRDYPVWNVDSADWTNRFCLMTENLLPEYKVNDAAERSFLRAFKALANGVKLDESFFRRIMWRAHQYALIFHVIRGAGGEEYLTDEDYGWATRVIEMQLADAGEVLQMCSRSDISRAIEAAEDIVLKLQSEGKPVTARAIVSKTRLITTSAMARFVLSVLGVPENQTRPRRLAA
jgi:hypothetical protein